MCLSSFPNTFYLRDCPFPIIYSWLFCHTLNDYRCVSLFLGSLFCSIDLCVCVYDNTTLLITGIPCFIALHFTVLGGCHVFLQIEGFWPPCFEQICLNHFSNSICSLHVSASFFSNSNNTSNF